MEKIMKRRKTLLVIILAYLVFCGCQKSVSPISPESDTQSALNNSPDDSSKSGFPVIPDTTKILFIGNSLTYFNNMPDMVGQLAELNNHEVLIEKATIGGTPLRQMVNNSFITNKINSNNWSYVVLQSDDITAFPDMYHIEINTLESFKTKIRNNNNSTKILYMMIWGLRNGVTIQELNGQFVYYSYTEYMQKIYNGTLHIANETDLIISPVGWTWKKVRNDHPGIELFASDNAHPSYKGSYLCAAVHYSVLFKESCTNIQFNGTLTNDEALILRSTASSIVLDSLSLWNLPVINGIY